MGFFHEMRSRMELYFAYTTKEVRDLIFCILVAGFVFSFNDWGTGGFSLVTGFVNFLLVTLLAALAFFVHLSVQRVVALMLGFKAEFKVWWTGLVISLVFAFVTATLFNFSLAIILPGGLFIAMLVRHRLGEFRYGVNYWENGVIAVWGPVASILLAFVFKILLLIFPGSWFLHKALLINLVYAVCSILPIPPLDGLNVFFAGRLLYIISFGLIIGVALLIYWANLLFALLGGLVIGLAIIFLYYKYIEAF